MTSSPQRQRPAASALPLAEQTVLTLRFSATPRGARLARRLASQQTDAWGWPYGSPVHDTVELIVAELAANAVTHGLVPGRDAELRLTVDPGCGLVRVEVSDVRGERLPVMPQGERLDLDGGRGLALVEALAEEWGVTDRLGVRARPCGPSFTAPVHNSSVLTSRVERRRGKPDVVNEQLVEHR